jgi:hypothetical protein
MSIATILVLLGMVPAVSGALVVTGYLRTGAEPVVIDSAYFQYGSETAWFPTTGWHCDTMATDSFVFPWFAGFPTDVKLAAEFNGMPLVQEFMSPARTVWNPFWDPHDQTQAMFDAPTGIEEGSHDPAGLYLAVSPSVVRSATVIRTSGTGPLELVDAAGRTVRTFPAAAAVRWAADDDAGRALPEGIYFFRLTAGRTAIVRKLTLAR